MMTKGQDIPKTLLEAVKFFANYENCHQVDGQEALAGRHRSLS